MKWQQFILSTSEFDKRFSSVLRFKLSEGEDIVNVMDDQCPDYFSEIDIKCKKENTWVFNSALYNVIHDKMMHIRFQRFLTSVCFTLGIPRIELNDVIKTKGNHEQQSILFLSLAYYMS